MTEHDPDPVDDYGRRIGRELHALSTRALQSFDAADIAHQIAVANTHRGATSLWGKGALGGRRPLTLILIVLATSLILALSVGLGSAPRPVSATNGRIAYALPYSSTYDRRGIYTVDPNGPGLPQQLYSWSPQLASPPTGNDSSADGGIDGPSWSPDGRHIAYRSSSGHGFALMVAAADGSDPRSLFRHVDDSGSDVCDGYPIAWSPDSTLIATCDGMGRPGEFVVLDVETGAVVLRHAGGWPTWSPDNSRLAFELAAFVPNKSGQSVHTESEIQVMDLHGGSPTTLAAWDGSHGIPGELEWSPDGSRIAYDQDLSLFVLDAADGPVHAINGGSAAPSQGDWLWPTLLQWSPDGTRILHVTNPAYPVGLARGITVSDATGTTVTVLDIPSYGAQWSPDGKSILSSQGNGTQATSIVISDASGVRPPATVVDLTGIEDSSGVEMSWQRIVP